MNVLKDMVKDKVVMFEFYRKGELWYTTECGFKFPVPISDTGDGTFLVKDKAILFMRYINKQIKEVEKEMNKSERCPCGGYFNDWHSHASDCIELNPKNGKQY